VPLTRGESHVDEGRMRLNEPAGERERAVKREARPEGRSGARMDGRR